MKTAAVVVLVAFLTALPGAHHHPHIPEQQSTVYIAAPTVAANAVAQTATVNIR